MRITVLSVLLCLLSISSLSAAESRRQRIEPEGLFDHPAYTHLVTVEGNWKTLYVAGQISVDENFNCVGRGDWRAQYLQVMEKDCTECRWCNVLRYHLHSALCHRHWRLMLRKESNPVPDYFQGQPPASTLIGVTALADECFLMEFDAIAAVPAE